MSFGFGVPNLQSLGTNGNILRSIYVYLYFEIGNLTLNIAQQQNLPTQTQNKTGNKYVTVIF